MKQREYELLNMAPIKAKTAAQMNIEDNAKKINLDIQKVGNSFKKIYSKSKKSLKNDAQKTLNNQIKHFRTSSTVLNKIYKRQMIMEEQFQQQFPSQGNNNPYYHTMNSALYSPLPTPRNTHNYQSHQQSTSKFFVQKSEFASPLISNNKQHFNQNFTNSSTVLNGGVSSFAETPRVSINKSEKPPINNILNNKSATTNQNKPIIRLETAAYEHEDEIKKPKNQMNSTQSSSKKMYFPHKQQTGNFSNLNTPRSGYQQYFGFLGDLASPRVQEGGYRSRSEIIRHKNLKDNHMFYERFDKIVDDSEKVCKKIIPDIKNLQHMYGNIGKDFSQNKIKVLPYHRHKHYQEEKQIMLDKLYPQQNKNKNNNEEDFYQFLGFRIVGDHKQFQSNIPFKQQIEQRFIFAMKRQEIMKIQEQIEQEKHEILQCRDQRLQEKLKKKQEELEKISKQTEEQQIKEMEIYYKQLEEEEKEKGWANREQRQQYLRSQNSFSALNENQMPNTFRSSGKKLTLKLTGNRKNSQQEDLSTTKRSRRSSKEKMSRIKQQKKLSKQIYSEDLKEMQQKNSNQASANQSGEASPLQQKINLQKRVSLEEQQNEEKSEEDEFQIKSLAQSQINLQDDNNNKQISLSTIAENKKIQQLLIQQQQNQSEQKFETEQQLKQKQQNQKTNLPSYIDFHSTLKENDEMQLGEEAKEIKANENKNDDQQNGITDKQEQEINMNYSKVPRNAKVLQLQQLQQLQMENKFTQLGQKADFKQRLIIQKQFDEDNRRINAQYLINHCFYLRDHSQMTEDKNRQMYTIEPPQLKIVEPKSDFMNNSYSHDKSDTSFFSNDHFNQLNDNKNDNIIETENEKKGNEIEEDIDEYIIERREDKILKQLDNKKNHQIEGISKIFKEKLNQVNSQYSQMQQKKSKKKNRGTDIKDIVGNLLSQQKKKHRKKKITAKNRFKLKLEEELRDKKITQEVANMLRLKFELKLEREQEEQELKCQRSQVIGSVTGKLFQERVPEEEIFFQSQMKWNSIVKQVENDLDSHQEKLDKIQNNFNNNLLSGLFQEQQKQKLSPKQLCHTGGSLPTLQSPNLKIPEIKNFNVLFGNNNSTQNQKQQQSNSSKGFFTARERKFVQKSESQVDNILKTSQNERPVREKILNEL